MRYFLMLSLSAGLLACGDPEDKSDDTAVEETDETDETTETTETTGDRMTIIMGLEGDVAAGKTLWNDNCTGCHATDGSGASGPDIRGEDSDEVVEVMLEGDGSMPDFAHLSDQELADILTYFEGSIQ